MTPVFLYIHAMKYRFLLFDADNTLLDFDENERVSILNTFAHLGLPCTEETLRLYHDINLMYWNMMAEGRIGRDELLTKRFETLFERTGIKGDPVETEDFYRIQLGMGHQLVPGALELCRSLYGKYRLFIITNGVARTQHERLEASGLAQYMEKLFISEEIGYNKPERGFFLHVEKAIEGFDPASALVIGDGLSSDIKGGADFGMDTCWLNIYNEENTSEIRPTYEIRDIVELKGILG